MPSARRSWALWAAVAGALAGIVGLAYADRALRRRQRPRRNPWRTLSNRRRVFLDDDGRVVRGLPEDLRGVHVQDLSELGARRRQIVHDFDCTEARFRPKKYKTKAEFLRAFEGANEHFLTPFFEGQDPGDQDLQDYRYYLDLGRDFRFASWQDAIKATIRGRATYDEAWGRLQNLVEIIEQKGGWRLTSPEETSPVDPDEALRICLDQQDEAIAALHVEARTGRLTAGPVPF